MTYRPHFPIVESPGARALPAAPLVTRFLAVVYAVVVGAGTVVTTFVALFSGSVTLRVPVESFIPTLRSGVTIDDGPTAAITGGGFSSMDATVSGLDVATRLWLAAGNLLIGGTQVVIAISIAVLCTRLRREDPFRSHLTRAIRTAAFTIVFGGLGWQLCLSIAGTLASAQLFQLTSWHAAHSLPQLTGGLGLSGLPVPATDISVEFWPIWAGLALFAVAAAFQHGERLQADTDGLV